MEHNDRNMTREELLATGQVVEARPEEEPDKVEFQKRLEVHRANFKSNSPESRREVVSILGGVQVRQRIGVTSTRPEPRNSRIR